MAALVKSKSKLPVYKYGGAWPPDLHPAYIELACFLNGRTPKQKGLGRFQHFKNAIQYFTPWMFEKDDHNPQGLWNPWIEEQCKSLCDDSYAVKIGDVIYRFVSWTGCKAAGKTFTAGFFAYVWWAAAPDISSVTLTSTSKTAVGQRVWPVIQKMHNSWVYPWTGENRPVGHIVDSMKKLQWTKGNDKYAIHALAVERSGDLNKAINSIKGRHTERMMLFIDEMNTSPVALVECIRNMGGGCKELVVLFIGNAISPFDLHGLVSEPKDGWGSISVNDFKWPTKAVPEWDIEPGVCLHFDGFKSPNVVAGRTLWNFLYSYENWLKARDKTETIQHMSQERGFWPKEGTSNTVFNHIMVEKYDARGKFTFVSHSTPLASLDPGFGGDGCIFTLALMGDTEDGTMGIQLMEQSEIEGSDNDSDPLDHQIAYQFIKLCKQNGVDPRYAGIDSTGIGRGVYAIVAKEWSQQVQRVEFGGSPTDMPASSDDNRESKKVYDRKVTELWYSVQEMLTSRQIKGFSVEAIIQFCTREYKMFGKVIKLDKKEECKEKLHRSPDHADGVSIIVHVARTNGMVISTKIEQKTSRDWEKLTKSIENIYEGAYTEGYLAEMS